MLDMSTNVRSRNKLAPGGPNFVLVKGFAPQKGHKSTKAINHHANFTGRNKVACKSPPRTRVQTRSHCTSVKNTLKSTGKQYATPLILHIAQSLKLSDRKRSIPAAPTGSWFHFCLEIALKKKWRKILFMKGSGHH